MAKDEPRPRKGPGRKDSRPPDCWVGGEAVGRGDVGREGTIREDLAREASISEDVARDDIVKVTRPGLRPGSARFFRRREEKYEVGLASAVFLRDEIARRLPLFEYHPGHAHTHVTTLYFDTSDRIFYRRAERHYDHNIKIRVKEYYYAAPSAGSAKAYHVSPHCFVELKENLNGAVIKRRFGFPKKDLSKLFRGEDVWPLLLRVTPADEVGPLHEIYREFKRFIGAYPIQNSSIVNYRRAVYQELEDDLRITFDDDIAVFPPFPGLYDHHNALTPEVLGKPVRTTDKIILEIKCPGDYPDWLQRALKYHSSKRLSKFTTSVRLLLNGDDTPPGLGADGRAGRDPSEDDTTLSGEVFR